MKSVNLIPTPRRDAKRRRRHRNVCAAACGAYGLLLAAAVGVAHFVGPGSGESLAERLAAADTDIHRFERQVTESRAELNAARATVEANRTVAEQPDWSVLLGLLGSVKGEDIVLRSVSVGPAPVPPPPPAERGKPAPPPAVPDTLLEVMGVGQTQLAVSQHVLRLEQTGLFSRVALLDTNREAFVNGNAIAFRLHCVFGEPKQPQFSQQWLQPGSTQQSAQPPAVTAVETGGVTR
jgi:hypothetical protein